ncbi:MAG: adenylate/guanylate cyclase domain-containing protein [Planctomycetes bacterium]|nr:adenylate/guanylate cyclase domain-containing protein [Planctomycetota bacterium]
MPDSFSFDVEFDAPVSEVWRVVSDTDMIDGAAGMPAIDYRDEPQPDGTSRRFASYKMHGFTFAYEELPFTWIHEQRYSVKRIYSKGAFKTFVHSCEIIPKDPARPEAGCTVRTTFQWEKARGFLGLFAASGTRNNGLIPYTRLFNEVAERLKNRPTHEKGRSVILKRPLEVDREDKQAPAANRESVTQFVNRTRVLFDSPLADRLEEAILTLPAEKLRRMQPYAFARRWSADRQKTLNQFLAATRAGLLKMRWDVICPHCRGDKMNLSTLGEVKEKAFCPSCNIDFDVDLDRSLEAVFMPHPQVREVPEAQYCLGGPGTTPHIVYQNRLEPGTEHAFEFQLAPGRYRVRVTGEKTYRWIEVQEAGAQSASEASPATNEVAFEIGDGELSGEDATALEDKPIRVRVKNASGRTALVVIESVEWARDALSAGELVADQRFRDLFSAEVLAPGISLAVEDSTILFTDVVGSTAMYNNLGDAKAFSLVRTHFDVLHEIVERHRGAIVKTIGDAIMAVFTRPDNALRAADELHRKVDEYVRKHGHEEGVQLKVGLHAGPCIAVTLNERLDYFGTTVNLAARVQGLSEGGDIITSKLLAERTKDCEPLRETGWQSRLEHANAKGFAEPVPVLRFTRGD